MQRHATIEERGGGRAGRLRIRHTLCGPVAACVPTLSARIDQRLARVRIDHATGRDVARRPS